MMKNLNFVSAQSEEDSNRLQALGCPPEIISISGSLKFDMAINVQQVNAAREDKENLDGRPVLVAASTRKIDGDDEEEHLLSAYKQALESEPRLLLVLVPRHPERFREVTAMIENHGLSQVKRSSGMAIGDNQVLLGDSMGGNALLPWARRPGICRGLACEYRLSEYYRTCCIGLAGDHRAVTL